VVPNLRQIKKLQVPAVSLAEKPASLIAPVYASTALAFASFGDAFLYAFLPVNNGVVGIPVMWVGILLSVNRIVRIFFNGVIVHFFTKHDLRTIMIAAVIAALVSTTGYSIASGIFLWLVCRILWGFAFSAMRIATIGYSLQHSRQGLALGISRSLQEAGPMMALLIAPFLLANFPVKNVFFLLSIFSLPAIWFALKLPMSETKTLPKEKINSPKLPSTLNSITLFSAILIDGIMVVVLGILFLQNGNRISLLEATSLAAFFLGYRRVCLVLLSAGGGWIAYRFGLTRIFKISLSVMMMGLIVLLFGWISPGIIVVFTSYGVNVAIMPGIVSQGKTQALNAVAENATWRDIGAATGTLIGGFLITSPFMNSLLLLSVIVLFLLIVVYVRTENGVKLWYQ
jgi:MFS family permease